MTITSYETLVERLGDLNITGVKVKHTYRPPNLFDGDLPCSWVRNVTGDDQPYTLQTYGGKLTFNAELVVAIQKIELGYRTENVENVIKMYDNISTAIRGINPRDPGGTNTANLGKGPVTWFLNDAVEKIGNETYHVVIATITAFTMS